MADTAQHSYTSTDNYYYQRKQRIRNADVLIIDEISMISVKILSQVEHVCRIIKDNNKLIGGIQTILVGDFYQLRPVPNMAMDDGGQPCFHHPHFSKIVPHRIQLFEVTSS